MPELIVRTLALAWRSLLIAAIVALITAAAVTIIGLDSLAHALGAIAWAAGLGGAIAGLISGAGR